MQYLYPRHLAPRFLCLILPAVSLVGSCSSADDPYEDLVGCEAYAHRSCDKRKECTPVSFAEFYVDQDACYSKTEKWCLREMEATGSAFTEAVSEACGEAVSSGACQIDYPAECQVAGALALGAVCYWDAQCQSTFCDSLWPECGTCAVPRVAGEPCLNDRCARGMATQYDDAGACTCVAAAELGQACNDAVPCSSGYCAAGICTRYPTVNENCTPEGSCAEDLHCEGVCVWDALVDVGQPCDRVFGPDCKAGFSCKPIDPSYPDSVCVVAAKVGEPCGETPCARGSSCLDGTCKEREAPVCG